MKQMDRAVSNHELEAQRRKEIALRKTSRWFIWLKIKLKLCFILQETPFSFQFDERAGRYLIRSSTRRKVSYIAQLEKCQNEARNGLE